jgi:hypothetical protein
MLMKMEKQKYGHLIHKKHQMQGKEEKQYAIMNQFNILFSTTHKMMQEGSDLEEL